jgi:hypothetical protein
MKKIIIKKKYINLSRWKILILIIYKNTINYKNF